MATAGAAPGTELVLLLAMACCTETWFLMTTTCKLGEVPASDSTRKKKLPLGSGKKVLLLHLVVWS